MLDRAPVSSMTAVFIFLLIVSGVTTGLSNIENWFLPKRVVINGVTPASVNVTFLYGFQLDGPINVIAIDKAGVRKVTNYSADGWYESGDNDSSNMSEEQVLHITSRSTSQVHFTIRECRIRTSGFIDSRII